MASTAELRDLWSPACDTRRLAAFAFWTGVSVTVDGRVLEALAALDGCMRAAGYRPKDGQTFGYACRRITGGSGYSLHAYGIAVDINSLANPYGPRLVTDMGWAMVDAIRAIRTTTGVAVWRWGGDFGGPYDAMHFEICCSPSALAAGIAPPSPSQEAELDSIERQLLQGAHDKAVAAVNYAVDAQARLVALQAKLADAVNYSVDAQARLAALEAKVDDLLAGRTA